MQVNTETEKAYLLFVMVPDDAENVRVSDGKLGVGVKEKYFTDWKILPVNHQWQLLCDDIFKITEDQAALVVDSQYITPSGENNKKLHFVNYANVCTPDPKTHVSTFVETAVESFRSLCEREKVYTVNPLGEWPPNFLPNNEISILDLIEQHYNVLLQWQEVQERTGRWVALHSPKN